mmetsp:Transcript_71654/g.167801  ORF Transcript_71654/g.167801 Transcript_71654/m.167801 type:complete len:388 (-) Transcript_71654:132-1295(-)
MAGRHAGHAMVGGQRCRNQLRGNELVVRLLEELGAGRFQLLTADLHVRDVALSGREREGEGSVGLGRVVRLDAGVQRSLLVGSLQRTEQALDPCETTPLLAAASQQSVLLVLLGHKCLLAVRVADSVGLPARLHTGCQAAVGLLKGRLVHVADRVLLLPLGPLVGASVGVVAACSRALAECIGIVVLLQLGLEEAQPVAEISLPALRRAIASGLQRQRRWTHWWAEAVRAWLDDLSAAFGGVGAAKLLRLAGLIGIEVDLLLLSASDHILHRHVKAGLPGDFLRRVGRTTALDCGLLLQDFLLRGSVSIDHGVLHVFQDRLDTFNRGLHAGVGGLSGFLTLRQLDDVACKRVQALALLILRLSRQSPAFRQKGQPGAGRRIVLRQGT